MVGFIGLKLLRASLLEKNVFNINTQPLPNKDDYQVIKILNCNNIYLLFIINKS